MGHTKSEDVQYATGEEWRAITNSFSKNEGLGKVEVTLSCGCLGGEKKAKFCKEQYCIENWNVRSMNQGKFDVVQQEIARMNIDILGISELKWTGTGEINSGHYYIYYCGQESLKRSGVALIVTKSLKCSIGVKFKNDRMILICFQGKPFNITAIQINATNTDAEEDEFDQFYEDLQQLLELTTKKKSFSS